MKEGIMNMQRPNLRALFAIVTAWSAAGCSPALAPPPSNAAGNEAAAAAAPRPSAAAAAPRFDRVVSTDIFAGFHGDSDALARGLARCEEALARNPIDPQPLMWHAM